MPQYLRPHPPCPHCGQPKTPVYGNHRRRPWWFCIPCKKGDERAGELLGFEGFNARRLNGRDE